MDDEDLNDSQYGVEDLQYGSQMDDDEDIGVGGDDDDDDDEG